MAILTRNTANVVIYAPLYELVFRLIRPHTLLMAEKYNFMCLNEIENSNMASRLRWHRYQKGMRQQDVADSIGLERSTYTSYEEEGRDYYPIDKMEKLAVLFGVPLTELLDDYHLFLYHGQGRQIKAVRDRLNMTQKKFGEIWGVTKSMVGKWENDRCIISRDMWKHLYDLR